MSEYFATEKKGKRQRCQIGCKVNVKSEQKRNNRPGSNSSCKYFLFSFFANVGHVIDWKLTSQHLIGVDAGDPHPSGQNKLRIICNHLTQVCIK